MAFLEPCDDKKILNGQLVTFAIWLAITAFGIYLSPSPHGHGTHEQLGLPPCPSVLFFNRPCPGCGLTTSWTATIHGRFIEAFHAHPLGPLLYLGFTYVALVGLWAYTKKFRIDTGGRAWSVGMMVGALVFFGFGFIRFALNDHFAAPDEITNYVQRLSRKS